MTSLAKNTCKVLLLLSFFFQLLGVSEWFVKEVARASQAAAMCLTLLALYVIGKKRRRTTKRKRPKQVQELLDRAAKQGESAGD